jgi:hypothetical protein
MIQKNVIVLSYGTYSGFSIYANEWANKNYFSNIFIRQSDIEGFKTYFDKQQSNKITKDCNIYPTTLSTLEKNKIEMFNDGDGPQVSITYTPRKTDYYLLNHQQISNYLFNPINYEEYFVFDYLPLQPYFKSSNWNSLGIISTNTSNTSNTSNTTFLLPAWILKEDNLPQEVKHLLTPLTPERILVCNGSHGNKTLEDKIKKWITFFNEERPNLIFDEVFNSQIFEGSVIDEDIYDSLDEILLSTDKENHKLAIETMANWDLEKSKIYLLFLFNKYKTKIEKKSYSGTKNHLMLLETFPYTKYSWGEKFIPFFNKMLEMFPEEKEVIKLLVIKRLNELIFKSSPIKNIEFKD